VMRRSPHGDALLCLADMRQSGPVMSGGAAFRDEWGARGSCAFEVAIRRRR